MARRALVEIIGEASGFIAATRKSSQAAASLSGDLKKLSVNAKASADAQVAASVKKTSRLRAEVAAYREIASAAERGSKEQIAAANLATSAEGRLARSMGVTAHEAGRLRASTSGVERDLSRATRGALAGSGVFRGLGRSIAFASGGFLAFASAGQFLRASFDAAKEEIVVQRQLAAQFRASGKDVGAYEGRIDALANRLALLAGFENDEVKAGFTTIFRATNDVSKALRDTATAADLARAKHMSFGQASLIVAKTEAGNTTLLRRQGFQIAKNATAEQALAQLRATIAGQAEAGTTAQERFGAVLHNTEEIIGTALLPTVNRYLSRGAAWLTQMNQSGRLQKDVATAAHDVGVAVNIGVGAFKAAVSVIRTVDKVTGSFENTLKDLAAVWLILKARMAINWAATALGIATTGAAAAAAEGEMVAFRASLLALGDPAVLAAIVAAATAIELFTNKQPLKTVGRPKDSGGNTSVVQGKDGSYYVQTRTANRGSRGTNLRRITPVEAAGLTSGTPPATSAGAERAAAPHGFTTGARTNAATSTSTARGGLSLQGQFNLLELKRADAERTNNTTLQRSILASEETITMKLRDQEKNLRKRTEYAQEAASIEAQIRGIDAASVDVSKKTATKAAEKAKKAVGGVSLALQVQEAKADALAAGSNAQSLTKAQVAARKAILAAQYRAIRSHNLSMEGLRDTWNEIAALNTDLKSQTGLKGVVGSYHRASTTALTAGLGLAHGARVALEERLAQSGAHRGYLPSAPAAQGQVIHIDTVNVHGVKNVDALYSELEKTARRRGQRRGTR